MTAEGSEASLWNDENVLELDISDSHTTLKRYILWHVKYISVRKSTQAQTPPGQLTKKFYGWGPGVDNFLKLRRLF